MNDATNDSYKFKYKNDNFANLIGIQLLESSDGEAKAILNVNKNLFNGIQMVHGGALFTLADLVFAAASNNSGVPAVSINATINYFKAVTEGTLTAKAKQVSNNKKLATYTVNITDEQNDLVATFLGTVYKKYQKKKNS